MGDYAPRYHGPMEVSDLIYKISLNIECIFNTTCKGYCYGKNKSELLITVY